MRRFVQTWRVAAKKAAWSDHQADPTHASCGKRTLATILRALAEHHNELENLGLIGVVVDDALGDHGLEKYHKSLVGATRHPGERAHAMRLDVVSACDPHRHESISNLA